MQQATTQTQKGLSGFFLKYLGMALMVLDHIEYFFGYTGKIPLFFSMLGRVAAPLFLFCLIEGFTHTRDRRKYFLRIYLISVFMGAVQFSFYNVGYVLVRPDGFFPQNQMLASFSILIVILQGFDWCAEKKWGRGLSAILVPLLLPAFVIIFMMVLPNPVFQFILNLLAYTVLPLHSFIMDGGTATLLFGIVLYLTRKNRKIQAASFAGVCILWDIVRLSLMVPDLMVGDFFTTALKERLSAYDLILLDVMMPDADGYTFCREIRDLTDAPILFLTAKSLEEDVDFGFSVGADDYIKKPFSILELRARISAHLRREQREKTRCFLVGSVRFFLAKKEVWVLEQKLSFTKSEYDICLLLAKNHGQIYSKEQIYENVFGYEKESDISAITEHIKNIRKKLALAGVSPIETIWGIGYRWNNI